MARIMGPVMGYGPHEGATADAQRRITTFFAAHLR